MAVRKLRLRERWQRLRSMPQFRNVLTFLAFVAVAILFWVIMALNDSITETFRVRVVMENVPDTVTFISDPPVDMHVTLRDKGTNILRSGVLKHPSVNLNFNDYARDGIFRMTRSDITSVLKASFGAGIQVTSMSLDSLRLYYTDQPGRRVPVAVRVEATASSGNIIAGRPEAMEKGVRIYSYGNEVDTINKVYTQLLVKRDLKQTAMFDVKLVPIKNVKIVPPAIRVKIPVEPLVLREGYARVETVNVPAGESLLLFPARVPVTYYVPMSKFNDNEAPITVLADYMDTRTSGSNKVAVSLRTYPDYVVNPAIKIDSLEYTLVRK